MRFSLTTILLLLPLQALANEPAGTIAVVRGKAEIIRNGGSIAAAKGADVYEGDRLVTGSDGLIKTLMNDEALLAVGPKSAITINQYSYTPKTSARNAKLSMAFGKFRVWVSKKLRSGSSFEIATPTAVAGVRGTHFMGIVTDTTAAIASIEGRVAVRNASADVGGDVALLDGQGTDVASGTAPTPPGTWSSQRFFSLLQETE